MEEKTMKDFYPNSSRDYAVEVETWCDRFDELMKEKNVIQQFQVIMIHYV